MGRRERSLLGLPTFDDEVPGDSYLVIVDGGRTYKVPRELLVAQPDTAAVLTALLGLSAVTITASTDQLLVLRDPSGSPSLKQIAASILTPFQWFGGITGAEHVSGPVGASGYIAVVDSLVAVNDDEGGQTNRVIGNARGQLAVDLQLYRVNADQVASGENSTIPGGESNKASGSYSFACGAFNWATGKASGIPAGAFNQAAGDYSYIAGGSGNTISNLGENSIILGGKNNTVSGEYSAAGGDNSFVPGDWSFAFGSANTVTGSGSAALGGNNTCQGDGALCTGYDTRTWASGQRSHGTKVPTLSGDTVQGVGGFTRFVMAGGTTDATPTLLKTGPVNDENITFDAAIAIAFTLGKIIAVKVGDPTYLAVFSVTGGVIANSVVQTAFVLANVTNTHSMPTPTIAMSGGNLQVQVTGIAETNLRWFAFLEGIYLDSTEGG